MIKCKTPLLLLLK